MEWNIYKDWLDPVLYRQMVSMIYQLSSNADKEAFLKQERENSLFYGICEHSMEEEYNLHYWKLCFLLLWSFKTSKC